MCAANVNSSAVLRFKRARHTHQPEAKQVIRKQPAQDAVHQVNAGSKPVFHRQPADAEYQQKQAMHTGKDGRNHDDEKQRVPAFKRKNRAPVIQHHTRKDGADDDVPYPGTEKKTAERKGFLHAER